MNGSLGDLIEDAARRAPGHEGVVGSTRRWTWAEVRDDVAVLAGALAASSVRPGDHVAVYRSKTAESLLAMWAVLWAGGVVVPVDAQMASGELAGLLERVAVRAAFVDRRTRRALPDAVVGLDVEQVLAGRAPGFATPVPVPRQPDDDAYIIHTSGSTGAPKGIVHTHRSALAYVELVRATYGFGPDDRIAGMSPLHFDMSTLELYVAPAVGAAVVVMDDALMRFPASFTARCEAERVTVWYTVPFFLQQVAARGALVERDLSALRWLLYGGEPFAPAALRGLVDALPGSLWVSNVYGPAEVNQCTVWSAPASAVPGDAADIPIGDVWAGARAAIVDRDGRPVAPGDTGELLIAADTAMRGYWGRADLTTQRLRPRPELGPGEWYATGDLAWRDPAGLLHCVGRVDHQVKIRGTRLDLDGIEAVLAAAPGVLHVVAGAAPDQSALVAAVVPGPAGFDPDAVRAWGRAHLPAVAVPRDIVPYEKFPETATGKIDRKRVRHELQECHTP